MAATIADIPSDVIHTHILPRLDGRSLSATATVSSHFQSLCSDDTLWAHITKSTWPSITHPRVDSVISTFPAGHLSFFRDSFPALFTDNHRRCSCSPRHPRPPEFISAVDIRYQNNVIYSTVKFTDTGSDFLSSELRIELSDDPTCTSPGSYQKNIISQSIGVKVDELTGADKATLSHLEESVTLSWVIIDPTRKRAGNISSIKPVTARQDWVGNDTVLRFVTVLPGPDPNEMVQCKIKLVLGVDVGAVGLHVKQVGVKLQDLNYRCLNGGEFLVIMQRAIMEENNVRRKVMDDEERWNRRREFKKMKREKKESERIEEEKREFAIKMNFVGVLVSFWFSIYFLMLYLK